MASPERRRAVAEKGKSIITIGQAHDYISQVTGRVAAARAGHQAALRQAAPADVTTQARKTIPE